MLYLLKLILHNLANVTAKSGAQVAQCFEHVTTNPVVGSSSLTLGTGRYNTILNIYCINIEVCSSFNMIRIGNECKLIY